MAIVFLSIVLILSTGCLFEKKSEPSPETGLGVVYFGAYEQDNNSSDGKEVIERLVLEKELCQQHFWHCPSRFVDRSRILPAEDINELIIRLTSARLKHRLKIKN